MKNSKSAVGIFLLCILLSTACAPDLTPEELLARAETAMAKNDLAAAEIDLKSVLRDSPDDPVARVMYGKIHMRRLETAAAVEQFERSLSARGDPETRLLFAQALVQAGESAELVSEWQLGSYATVEDRPRFQAVLAQAFLAQAQPELAKSARDRALAGKEGDDSYIDFTNAIVTLQVDRNQEAAETILKTLVERDPTEARAWSLLGLLARQAGELEAAEQYYQRAAEANPYRLADKVQLVETQLRQGKAELAGSNLTRLEKQIPNFPEIRFMRAQLLFDEGEYAAAIDLLNQILSLNPDSPGALLLAANANARLDKFPMARRHLERFLELQPGNVRATQQLAQVNALLGQPQKTEELARALLERDEDDTLALNLLANALAAQGFNAESAQVFQRLTELQPESTGNLVALASQQIVSGDISGGISKLQSAVARDPQNAQARERLIEANLVTGDLEAAAEAASDYAEAMPESASAAVYLGRVRLQEQELDAAREMFERALELDPGNVSARGGLAGLHLMNRDLEGARGEFEAALEANPGNLQSSMNLAVVLEQLGDLDAMESTLYAAIDANPAALAPRLAIARKALLDSDSGTAIEMLAAEVVAEQNNPDALQILTGAYILAEQRELALTSAAELLKLRGESPQALAIAARAETLSQKYSAAEELLARALAVAPDVPALRKGYIESLVAQRKFERAAQEIDKLPAEVQEEPAVLLLDGRLALARGELDDAEEILTRVHERAPSGDSLSLLATAAWESGQRDDALELMADWLEAHPGDTQVRSVLAARQIESGDESAARGNYQILVEAQSENVIVLNNLAWLLRIDQPTTALEYIRQADRLAPDSASVKDTYAMVELERGEYTRALSLNQRAMELAPESRDITLNRARILARAGREGEARYLLERMLEEPESAVTGEARALLDAIKT